jgi:hypothetical protein
MTTMIFVKRFCLSHDALKLGKKFQLEMCDVLCTRRRHHVLYCVRFTCMFIALKAEEERHTVHDFNRRLIDAVGQGSLTKYAALILLILLVL